MDYRPHGGALQQQVFDFLLSGRAGSRYDVRAIGCLACPYPNHFPLHRRVLNTQRVHDDGCEAHHVNGHESIRYYVYVELARLLARENSRYHVYVVQLPENVNIRLYVCVGQVLGDHGSIRCRAYVALLGSVPSSVLIFSPQARFP